jgi:hypothetical protein
MALLCIAPDTSIAADTMNNIESSFVFIIAGQLLAEPHY